MTWTTPASAQTFVPDAPPPQSTMGRRFGGFAMMLPALVLLLVQLVIPSVQTMVHSLQNGQMFRGTKPTWAGLDNYHGLELGRPIAIGLGLAVLPTFVALIVGPLVGGLGNLAGAAPRYAARALVAMPAVFFSPAAFYTADLMHRIADGWVARTPGQAIVTMLGIGFAASFGLVSAVSSTVFLAALKPRRAGSNASSPGVTAALVSLVIVLSMVAIGLQSFALPWIVTGGARLTSTPGLLGFQAGFGRFSSGPSSAYNTILLIILGILGIVVTAVLVFSRMRLEIDTKTGTGTIDTADRPSGSSFAGIAAVIVAALVLVVAVVVSRHWLASAMHSISPERGHPFLYTWGPATIGTALQVLVALLAGVGLGALRPFGRWSEAALFVFAPWLLVGGTPLAVTQYLSHTQRGWSNTFVGLIPPVTLNVPAVVAFTLLAAAVARVITKRDAGTSRTTMLGRVWVPASAATVAVVGALLLVNAQRVLWPLVIANTPDTAPAQILVMLNRQTMRTASPASAELYPLALVVLFALFTAAVAIGLDRVALRSGRSDDAS